MSAPRSEPEVSRVRDRRLSPGEHRTSRRPNCNLILPAAVALGDDPSGSPLQSHCLHVGHLTWWDVVMKLRHSLSENKTPLFLCHVLQLSLYPRSGCVPPKLNLLEIAFNAPVPEPWRAELCSAVLRAAQQKRRDFTLRRRRRSRIKPHFVGGFLF